MGRVSVSIYISPQVTLARFETEKLYKCSNFLREDTCAYKRINFFSIPFSFAVNDLHSSGLAGE